MEILEMLESHEFQEMVHAAEAVSGLKSQVFNLLASTKTWEEMSEDERNLCVQYLVAESQSKTELGDRLCGIGCTDHLIRWPEAGPASSVSAKTQKLIKVLGWKITKNGVANVMIVTANGIY